MPQQPSDFYTTTFQTRPCCSIVEDAALASCATLFGTVKRTLFADLAKGKTANECKSLYIRKFGITARQFNSIRIQHDGNVSSIKARNLQRCQSLRDRIESLNKFLKKCKRKSPFILHQKKRQLARTTARLCRLEKDIEDGRVRLCFGSKKLFRAQFSLSDNGYKSHEEWKKDWTSTRSSEFFLVGSKDETSGNQSATATVQADGKISLRIRLPDALQGRRKYFILKDLYFSYGHEQIVAALSSRVAISYRFVRDKKGWRIFATLPVRKPPTETKVELGVIGVDINADHLAVTETDRFGNFVRQARLTLNTYGKSRGQTRAAARDVAKDLINLALLAQKPVVLEELSFDKKKNELRQTGNPKYARMLSSFAYSEVEQCICSSAARNGVEVGMVNPAYTSIIGRAKFCRRYGLSTHGAAALCIGRRFLGVSERLPRHLNEVADGRGGFVAVPLPVRNRGTHVWSLWRDIGKKLSVALVVRFWAEKKRSSKPVNLALCDAVKASGAVGEIPARESIAEPLGCRTG